MNNEFTKQEIKEFIRKLKNAKHLELNPLGRAKEIRQLGYILGELVKLLDTDKKE